VQAELIPGQVGLGAFELMLPPSGQVIARDVEWEAFLSSADWEHVEWVDGWVVTMPGIELTHDRLNGFLRVFLTAFLQAAGIEGKLFQDPVLVKLKNVNVGRAPDLMLFLPDNDAMFEQNAVIGTPDLIVEIVSPQGDRRDRVEKFREYERAGVLEYWILDYRFREAAFYHLDEGGLYQRAPLDENGLYASRVLPRLRFKPEMLWQETLPTLREILLLVEMMVKSAAGE
jgi:Uma2 family endonuclease